MPKNLEISFLLDFLEELDRLQKEYAGRPSLLYYAEKMTIGQLQECAVHILGVILRCDSVKRILKKETVTAEAETQEI